MLRPRALYGPFGSDRAASAPLPTFRSVRGCATTPGQVVCDPRCAHGGEGCTGEAWPAGLALDGDLNTSYVVTAPAWEQPEVTLVLDLHTEQCPLAFVRLHDLGPDHPWSAQRVTVHAGSSPRGTTTLLGAWARGDHGGDGRQRAPSSAQPEPGWWSSVPLVAQGPSTLPTPPPPAPWRNPPRYLALALTNERHAGGCIQEEHRSMEVRCAGAASFVPPTFLEAHSTPSESLGGTTVCGGGSGAPATLAFDLGSASGGSGGGGCLVKELRWRDRGAEAPLSAQSFALFAGDAPGATRALLGEWTHSRMYDEGQVECYKGEGLGYLGNTSTTISGWTCKAWAEAPRHQGRLPSVASPCPDCCVATSRGPSPPSRPRCAFKQPSVPLDIGESGNLCRNPGRAEASQNSATEYEAAPWCYTTAPNTRWEVCAQIPKCSSSQSPVGRVERSRLEHTFGAQVASAASGLPRRRRSLWLAAQLAQNCHAAGALINPGRPRCCGSHPGRYWRTCARARRPRRRLRRLSLRCGRGRCRATPRWPCRRPGCRWWTAPAA